MMKTIKQSKKKLKYDNSDSDDCADDPVVDHEDEGSTSDEDNVLADSEAQIGDNFPDLDISKVKDDYVLVGLKDEKKIQSMKFTMLQRL